MAINKYLKTIKQKHKMEKEQKLEFEFFDERNKVFKTFSINFIYNDEKGFYESYTSPELLDDLQKLVSKISIVLKDNGN